MLASPSRGGSAGVRRRRDGRFPCGVPVEIPFSHGGDAGMSPSPCAQRQLPAFLKSESVRRWPAPKPRQRWLPCPSPGPGPALCQSPLDPGKPAPGPQFACRAARGSCAPKDGVISSLHVGRRDTMLACPQGAPRAAPGTAARPRRQSRPTSSCAFVLSRWFRTRMKSNTGFFNLV